MAVPSSEIHKIQILILDTRGYNSRWKWMEIELNFLDLIIVINKKRMLGWFHKPTFSGRYLNYLSTSKFSEERRNNGNG